MYMQSYGRNSGGSNRSGGFRSRFRKSAPRKSVQYEHSRFIKKAKPVEVTHYTSKHTFADFQVCDQIKANLTAKGFTSPTAIQDQAIPILLTNQDLVGIANTGTGKTGAFLIPLLEKINNNRGNEKVLVMVPTRELAIQIETELRAFSRNMNISSVLCIGGTPIGQQIRALGRKFDFVIGTPGRLKDLVNRRLLNLEHFKSVVLDEVDRMLDMGFIADIRILMAKLPKERQTLFFSATMDKTIEPLMHEFLVSPAKVSVKTGETSDNVEQDVVRFSRIEEKTEILSNLLNTIESEQILIFDRTKGGVEDLCYELNQRGFKAVSIHGDKSQSHRFLALKQFKANHAKILVATDVAARGLDMNVSHVINFDTPDNYETYVHRIGRTGRAGKTGVALTFVRG